MKNFWFYIFILLFAVVVGSTLFWIDKINRQIYAQDLQKKVDNSLKYSLELISDEKKRATQIAVLLSKNEKIISGYIKNDRKTIFDELKLVLESIKFQNSDETVDIQMHTSDLKSYVKSWNFDDFGTELKSFRKGLLKVKETQEPIVSIELGRRLNIKAIAPITINKDFLGSVEVIFGFENIEKKMLEQKIKFIVLLEKQYLKLAVDTKKFDSIDNYAQITQSCKNQCLKELKNNILKIDNSYIKTDEFVFGFIPLYDISGQKLGFIGVAFEVDALGESHLLYNEKKLIDFGLSRETNMSIHKNHNLVKINEITIR